MNKKKLGIIAAGVALCAAAVAGYAMFGWKRLAHGQGLNLDLSQPDALIVTRSLSSLPRDLLTIALARDVLREDFVFYYEQNGDKLGLQGTLRRIAYEHELGWGDQMIRTVLDEPADVALWREEDGSLKYFAIAVSRNSMTRMLEQAGKVALKDTQMKLAGEIRVDGDKVPVYSLNYAHQRTLLIAARGTRMVILSDPGMVFGADGKADGKAETTVAGLLAADPKKQQAFRQQFHLDAQPTDGHSVAVKADVLAFGYQPFFGALDALRFDFSKGQWQTRALVDAGKLAAGGYDNRALWPVVPHNPAACFALPANWAEMTSVLGEVDASALTEQLSGPAAVCWYGSSRLYTPLVVATRKAGGSDELYGTLFAAAIGNKKSGAVQKAAGPNGAVLWQREVATGIGAQHPTLAVSGQTVLFSPDRKLVEQALAVSRKQAPAIADRLADPSRTVGLIAPASLAELIRKEAFDALPSTREPVLRAAADAHLVPRLNALKKYPPYRLVLKSLPASGVSWQPLEWQALEK
ncbi:DUF2138 family protein [Massilia pseudoviolaceinigra]|uniref:DUF2138 family protein n=1 Tax=Massilia pseudoviolaceinigra TaxID=3057165 RepID=UPI0027969B25|nr:DUF2138 family protein [Massilia sp. CCM 9206]MDQ1923232.1 DUF2138 family protein [Massilia sp. CCM 9206]